MKNIAAICACPPHFNPGMHLTDFALGFTLSRLGGMSSKRHVLYLPSELRPFGGGDAACAPSFGLPFDYDLLRGNLDTVLGADAILFWGDFLHSRHYRQAVANLLVRTGVVASLETATEIVDEHLFLRSAAPEILLRTISFGDCLLMDDGSGACDARYEALARRFFSGVRGAWMRDALSAARVSEMRGDAESHLGVDPSLLLHPADYGKISEGASPGAEFPGNVAVFLARTNINPELSLGLAKRVAAAADVGAVWLPWFSVGALEAGTVRSLAPEIAGNHSAETLPQLIASLRSCRLVVTDAYHLCLTAWNIGIPAVCVSRAAERFTTALSEKKKEIFYATFGADDFLVFAEELEITSKFALDRLVRSLNDVYLIRSIQDRIARHRDRSERDLHARMKEIVGG